MSIRAKVLVLYLPSSVGVARPALPGRLYCLYIRTVRYKANFKRSPQSRYRIVLLHDAPPCTPTPTTFHSSSWSPHLFPATPMKSRSAFHLPRIIHLSVILPSLCCVASLPSGLKRGVVVLWLNLPEASIARHAIEACVAGCGSGALRITARRRRTTPQDQLKTLVHWAEFRVQSLFELTNSKLFTGLAGPYVSN